MKRKIVIGLAAYAVCFMLIGIYIIITVNSATDRLDNLVKLHQVEILRERLLIDIKSVQADLTLRDTPYARSGDAIVSRAMRMDRLAGECFRCHHSEGVRGRLFDLKSFIERYKVALNRVLTMSANTERLQAEKDLAFRSGEELIGKVNGMIALTRENLAKHTKAVTGGISRTKTMLFVLIGLGPILSVGLALIFIRSITGPVQELLAATRRLKGGDLEYRVGALQEEFGELAGAFNEMAGSLKEHMLEMQRTEQMVVAGELAAGLAHEIKNPIAGIKVAMEVLSRDEGVRAEDREVLSKVSSEVRRLEALMKSFLNFAKPPKPRFERVNANDVLRGTLDFYRLGRGSVPAGQGVVSISEELAPGVPDRWADPQQLQQVFLNLFLNAVEAMPAGGTLSARTGYDAVPDRVWIEISDSGKGIDEGMKENIFQPFFTTKPKGTGLGLPTCRQLIEQQGGSIRVEDNPSGGAVFRIELPGKDRAGEERA